MNPLAIIEKYYSKKSDLYSLLIKHSESVKNKALAVISKHPELNVDVDFVAESAMLHDIGIFKTYAPQIFCFGNHKYVEHGYLGAELLVNEGFPFHALVAERHTGTGIKLNEIISRKMPLPHREMTPQSIEEQIVCYADKFYSKTHPDCELQPKEIRKNIEKYGLDKVMIFNQWDEIFG